MSGSIYHLNESPEKIIMRWCDLSHFFQELEKIDLKIKFEKITYYIQFKLFNFLETLKHLVTVVLNSSIWQ